MEHLAMGRKRSCILTKLIKKLLDQLHYNFMDNITTHSIKGIWGKKISDENINVDGHAL
jgi:hypothetical protein